MPNWCDNDLTITGPTNIIKSLFSKSISLQDILPCPKELLDLSSPAPNEFQDLNIKKYGQSDWYNWNIHNWGTKWDPGPFDGEVEEATGDPTKSSFHCSFQSAWAPPTNAFRFLAEKHPELTVRLEYFESGCTFFGVATNESGAWVDDYREYSNAADLEEQLEECPCYLAEGELEYLKEMEEEQAKGEDDDQ